MEAQPLITKYRPNNVADVFGHVQQKKLITREIESPSSQCFLISGPAGTGKTTLARILARGRGAEAEELNAADTNGVDAVREIAARQLWTPALGRTRAVIFDECHQLTKQAQQVLLKPTEDPPKHVTWIFCTTEPSKITKALRDRCTQVKLDRLPDDKIDEFADDILAREEIEVSDAVFQAVLEYSQGIPRRALQAIDQVRGVKSTKAAKAILSEVPQDDSEAFALARALGSNKTAKLCLEIVAKLPAGSAEGARILIFRYFTTALAKGGWDSYKLRVLKAFSQPYPSGDNGYLIVSLGEVFDKG